jgi:hypothetical protein
MRKLIIIILVLGTLVASAYVGRRGYRAWKWRHAVSQARELMAKGEFKDGTLWLRKALEANPGSVDAVRMMGDFNELIRSPNTIFWRERLVRIEPKNSTNQLLLARARPERRMSARKTIPGCSPFWTKPLSAPMRIRGGSSEIRNA